MVTRVAPDNICCKIFQDKDLPKIIWKNYCEHRNYEIIILVNSTTFEGPFFLCWYLFEVINIYVQSCQKLCTIYKKGTLRQGGVKRITWKLQSVTVSSEKSFTPLKNYDVIHEHPLDQRGRWESHFISPKQDVAQTRLARPRWSERELWPGDLNFTLSHFQFTQFKEWHKYFKPITFGGWQKAAVVLCINGGPS